MLNCRNFTFLAKNYKILSEKIVDRTGLNSVERDHNTFHGSPTTRHHREVQLARKNLGQSCKKDPSCWWYLHYNKAYSMSSYCSQLRWFEPARR